MGWADRVALVASKPWHPPTRDASASHHPEAGDGSVHNRWDVEKTGLPGEEMVLRTFGSGGTGWFIR